MGVGGSAYGTLTGVSELTGPGGTSRSWSLYAHPAPHPSRQEAPKKLILTRLSRSPAGLQEVNESKPG